MRKNTIGSGSAHTSAAIRQAQACGVAPFQAMYRALAALQRRDTSDQVRTVAAEAKVSTAWLYRQEELRVRIMRSRKTVSQMASPAPASQLRATVPTEYRDDATATDQGSGGKEQRTDRTARARLRCNRSNSSLWFSITSDLLVIQVQSEKSRFTSQLQGTNVLEARFVASLRIADNPPADRCLGMGPEIQAPKTMHRPHRRSHRIARRHV
jgi:hypothetical protein